MAVPSPVRPLKPGSQKMSQPSPKTIPDWQTERAKKLHRACLSVQRAVHRGGNVGTAIARASRRLHGWPFKCDPARRLSLSQKTMRRNWDAWRRGGQVPAALRLQYLQRRPQISARLLIRFADFCSRVQQPSVKTAWQNFSARGGSFGRGRRTGNRLKITCGQICYHFPAAVFYQMQAELKAIQTARMNLGQLRLKTIAGIRDRLPDRCRAKREMTFEI